MYRIYNNHSQNLPFVRIKRLELTNFKGVSHGVIEFNCAKEFIPYNTKSDILGLYGQNGSGKSAMVEAISTVKALMSGYSLTPNFAKRIDISAEYAIIRIDFDFQYRSGECATVSYEVKLERKEKKQPKTNAELTGNAAEFYPFFSEEIIKTNLYADGKVSRMHTIVDTKDKLFCPDGLDELFFGKPDSSTREELVYLKRRTYEESQSFVFCNALSEMINEANSEEHHSKYYEILAELNLFAENYLFVIGTKTSGLVQLRAGIPIYFPEIDHPIIVDERIPLTQSVYQLVEKGIAQINVVMGAIIPELKISLRAMPTVLENGEDGVFVKLMSERGEKAFPFDYESDGIIKLFSIIADFIYTFNQGSATLVVDEFDSGVFEYLLGELLEVFEQSGKGQFIFTSHNLRPLEVIDKKFIRFTTADPENRYYKLKNIGKTNNLRDLYLRQVQLGDQDVEMYRHTKATTISKIMRGAWKEPAHYE